MLVSGTLAEFESENVFFVDHIADFVVLGRYRRYKANDFPILDI